MNSLPNRLQIEKVALEHPQAVEKFLRETEYLREKPAKRHFSDRGHKTGLLSPSASTGVLAILIVVIRMF